MKVSFDIVTKFKWFLLIITINSSVKWLLKSVCRNFDFCSLEYSSIWIEEFKFPKFLVFFFLFSQFIISVVILALAVCSEAGYLPAVVDYSHGAWGAPSWGVSAWGPAANWGGAAPYGWGNGAYGPYGPSLVILLLINAKYKKKLFIIFNIFGGISNRLHPAHMDHTVHHTDHMAQPPPFTPIHHLMVMTGSFALNNSIKSFLSSTIILLMWFSNFTENTLPLTEDQCMVCLCHFY